jgi:hypothetical protein
MKLVITHRSSAPLSRRETLDGREYLVVPVVALVEGVLNGIYAPADEIAQFPDSWNGRPITVNHPMDGELPISANGVRVLERQQIGQLFNARVEGGRLSGEIWIDAQKARRLGGEAAQVLARLEAGEHIEVSTGYFAEIEPTAGEFGGKPYSGIYRHIRPDHLAVLPNAEGACNRAMGCGAPRVNVIERMQQTLVALAAKLGIGDDPDPEKESATMDKKDTIDALIANQASGFAESDRKMLEGLDEKVLSRLCAHEHKPGEPCPHSEQKPAEKPAVNAEAPAIPAEVAALLAKPGALATLARVLEGEATRKTALAAKLAANAACKLTAEQLGAMDEPTLTALEQSLLPTGDYSGRGFPATDEGGDADYAPPAIFAAPVAAKEKEVA